MKEGSTLQPVLDYEPPTRVDSTLPPPFIVYERNDVPIEETHWDSVSLVLAGLTTVYSVICCVAAFATDVPGGLGLLALGFVGNWIGGGLGLLCALIGCFRVNDRWTGSLGALAVNLLVVGVPLLVGAIVAAPR
jgi:hypothetical protein